jgi:nucleobase:cation symporter-1, NCS1 family
MTTDTMPRLGDMPTREGDLTIEGRGIEPIPESARYGSINRVFTVWFTPNLVPAAFFLGTLAAADFLQIGFVNGVIAIVLGNILGSILVGALATMGPATGMAQMPLARLAYGKSIIVPGLLNWISCIGWDGVNSVFGAAALSILTGVPFIAALVVIVIAQGALGVVGYEAIHTFEKWGAIALGVMFVIVTIGIFGNASGVSRADGMSGLDGLGAFVTYTAISASFVLAWGLYASDYTRYLPSTASKSRVFLWTVLGLSLAAGWIEILGLAVADRATGTSVETIRDLVGGGILGALALAAIAIGTVAVNAMNDYTGSLSLQAAGLRIRRVYSAVTVAVLGFLFTIYLHDGDLVHKFESFLLLILYWVTPWAAVVLVDWWQRGQRADVSGLADFARLPTGGLALASLIIGFLVSVPFQQSEVGFDLAAATGLPINTWASDYLHFADVAFIVGFVVAGLIYWLGSRSMRRT